MIADFAMMWYWQTPTQYNVLEIILTYHNDITKFIMYDVLKITSTNLIIMVKLFI